MLIRTMGFNLKGGQGLDLNRFFQNLAANSYRTDSTILSVINRNGYWVGVLLSIRNQRSFCKMQNAGSSYTITIQELLSNESPVEFNFFLINQATFKGIYLHYFHSRALTTCLSILKNLYDSYKDQLIRQDCDALDADALGTKKRLLEAKKNIREQYNGSITYSVWVKPESFSQVLARLAEVKNLEIDVETIAVEEPAFRPLADVSKSIKQRYSFSSLEPVGRIKTAITTTMQNLGDSLFTAKVTGVDPTGMEVVYTLANNVDYISSYDYDGIVAGLEIRSNDIENSLLGSNLVTQMFALTQSPLIREILNTPQAA